jgi:hypothetical protein
VLLCWYQIFLTDGSTDIRQLGMFLTAQIQAQSIIHQLHPIFQARWLSVKAMCDRTAGIWIASMDFKNTCNFNNYKYNKHVY